MRTILLALLILLVEAILSLTITFIRFKFELDRISGLKLSISTEELQYQLHYLGKVRADKSSLPLSWVVVCCKVQIIAIFIFIVRTGMLVKHLCKKHNFLIYLYVLNIPNDCKTNIKINFLNTLFKLFSQGLWG